MGAVLNAPIRPGAPVSAVPRSFYNKVDEILTRLEVWNGFIERNGTSWTIATVAGGFPWDLVSFGPVQTGPKAVTIKTGNFIVRGRIRATLAADAALTLTGSVAEIYVEIDDIADATVSVGFTPNIASEPIGKIRHYLWQYTLADDGGSYYLTKMRFTEPFLDTPA